MTCVARSVPRLDVPALLRLGAPLLLIGVTSGALHALAQRPGLGATRRRVLQVVWVLLLLVGVPLWLVLAAALRIW